MITKKQYIITSCVFASSLSFCAGQGPQPTRDLARSRRKAVDIPVILPRLQEPQRAGKKRSARQQELCVRGREHIAHAFLKPDIIFKEEDTIRATQERLGILARKRADAQGLPPLQLESKESCIVTMNLNVNKAPVKPRGRVLAIPSELMVASCYFNTSEPST